MNKKIILIFVILTIISSTFVFGGSQIASWYNVANWELEVCSKWGGTQEAQQISTMQTSEIYLSQLTLTLQGKKTIYPDNISLYEFAWYIHPTQNSVDYQVLAYNENGSMYAIDEGTVESTAMFGGGGYKSLYSNQSYTRVKINYNQDTLDVPIVEIQE